MLSRNKVFIAAVTFFIAVLPMSNSSATTPVFSSSGIANFAENGTGTAYTAIADVGVYTITGGADQALFDIDGTTGAVTFKVAPNFEAPADADNSNIYEIVITATGATSFSTKSVSITVTDVSEVPSGGGGSGGGSSSGSSAPVLKTQGAITITSSVTTIEYGNSFKISVSGGNSSGVIKYSSTGTALCAITSDGLVTAVGKGSCVITATKEADGVYAATSTSITITVTDVTVAGVVTTTPTATTQTMSISKVVAGITTAKVKIGIDYAGERVSVLLGTKVNGKTTYKTLGSTTVGSTGYVTYKSKVKMPKGSVLRLKSGSEVIFTRTIS